MSAYLVQPHHAAYLARYYVDHCLKWGGIPGGPVDAADVAQLLARANMDSLRARYGDDGAGDPAAYIAECRRNAMQAHWPSFDPVTVIKAAHCFDYQACELPDYDLTMAALITRRIASSAPHDLPGYDAAPWGAPEPMAKRAAVPRKPAKVAPTPAPIVAKPRRHGLYIVK